MTSVNLYPTFAYEQPSEYRFSHDSVFLARWVYEFLARTQSKAEIQELRVLDLCAGCGVIGLDLTFHLQKELGISPSQIDFLEVQESYKEHFFKNLNGLIAPVAARFLNSSYDELLNLEEDSKYDLVVSNPPYFHVGEGKLSPSNFKNRCRFFIDSSFENYLLAVGQSLRLRGLGMILLKSRQEHGWDVLTTAQKILTDRFDIQVVGEIRGTDIVQIRHSS